jgi:general secretion pathway protein G
VSNKEFFERSPKGIPTMTLRLPARNRATRRAFTLMEMLIVVAIIVILAGIGTFYLLPQFEQSKVGVARAGAYNIEKAVITYYKDHDQYPTDPSLLCQKDQAGYGPYIPQDALLDPWGKMYTIDPSGSISGNGGAKPDVYTTGPNGQTIGNWGKR